MPLICNNRRRALLPTILGQVFQGGFWGGNIAFGGHTYAIVVAPKASGEKTATALVPTLSNTPSSASTNDSVANTTGLASLTGSSTSAAAAFVKGLTIGGYNDWQIPAKDVLTVLMTNLRPGLAAAPAIYKTGGAEAFATNTSYWSSTTFDWTRTDSTTTGGDPIYGQQTTTQTTSHSFDNGPVGESVDYSSYVSCSTGSPYSVNGPNFSPSGNTLPDGERIGYWSASWMCTDTVTSTVVIGYTPEETTYTYTPMYQAYAGSFNGTSTTAYNKNSSFSIRAVRLVQIA